MISSERRESSAFLLRFPLMRQPSGGMMPKLTFIGWKLATVVSLTYSPSAPMAVSRGKSMGVCPSSRRAISTPARKPDAADST